MAEKKTTKSFKENLAKELNGLLEDFGFSVKTEFGKGKLICPSFEETNQIDIIIHKDSSNPNSFVGIEIEFFTSQQQIKKNLLKFKDLANGSKRTKLGLLHLILWDVNVSKQFITKLIYKELTELTSFKTNRFFYTTYLYYFEDKRQTKAEPEKLVKKDWAFGSKLLALLKAVFNLNDEETNKILRKMEWW